MTPPHVGDILIQDNHHWRVAYRISRDGSDWYGMTREDGTTISDLVPAEQLEREGWVQVDAPTGCDGEGRSKP